MTSATLPLFAHALRSQRQLILRLIAIGMGVAVLFPLAHLTGDAQGLPYFFFMKQDIWLVALILLSWPLLAKSARPGMVGMALHPIIVAGLLVLVGYAGHYLLLLGYDASRDEQMAVFDAAIFAQGRLAAPIATQWREVAPALNQLFMFPIGLQEAWVSAYLPVNAGLRALVGLIADPVLTSPLLVGIGAIALFGVARRLWPDRRDVPIACLLLYAGSGQIIFTGMTAYAMNGHLALNLIWLWLFLIDSKRADIAALMIGFLATGLHQPLFHPLFAAPILFLLLMRREWPRAVLYLIGYALISAFWLWWPMMIAGLATTPSLPSADDVDYATRLREAFAGLGTGGIWTMTLNLLRMAAWQHILFLPIFGLGLVAVWRARDPLGLALAAGVLLPVLLMLILLPYQGHGWGYRYVHGVLGNAILLAGYGWARWGRDQWPLLRNASLLTFATLMPLQGWFMHDFYASFAKVDRQIARSKADIALIDSSAFYFARDLVLNAPDVSNRPVRLDAMLLEAPDYAKLCAGGVRIIAIGAQEFAPTISYFNNGAKRETPDFARQILFAKSANCQMLNRR